MSKLPAILALAVAFILGGLSFAEAHTALSADTVIYANDSTGTDGTNTCATSATPCTSQGALNYGATLDLNGFNLTIQAATNNSLGTGLSVPSFFGNGMITYDGGGGTIAVTGGSENGIANYVPMLQRFRIQNVKITVTGSQACLTYGSCGWCIVTLVGPADFQIGNGVTLGPCHTAALAAVGAGSMIQLASDGSFTLAGGGTYALEATETGQIVYSDAAVTVTLTGTPGFSDFALAYQGGNIQWPVPSGSAPGVAFSGSATGAQYFAGMNGLIYRGGTPGFPGSAGGSTGTGGQYQ